MSQHVEFFHSLIFFMGGGGTPHQLKFQVLSPDQIFIFGGRGYSRPTFLKYEWGTQGILNQKLW